MRQAAGDWNSERRAAGQPLLKIGYAVEAGDVIFGAVGDADRLELTVIGDPVNRAAKLENWNKHLPSTALTSRATYDLAIEQGFDELDNPDVRPKSRVDGIAAPVDLVVLAPA